jgi:hypothetical protein
MSGRHWLALGDYDGDQRTDRAIVDALEGTWYVLTSSGVDPTALGIPWGWHWGGMDGTRHLLVLGDYDGDGRTDRAIVDAFDNRWYVIASSGRSGIEWGWRWDLRTSPPCSVAISDCPFPIGPQPPHVAVTGDYDGDGISDRAMVWLGTDGWRYWSWVPSSGGTRQTWSLAPLDLRDYWPGMILPGRDYDGDGSADPAKLSRGRDEVFYLVTK